MWPRACRQVATSSLNLQWPPEAGALKGLMFRLRYSHVEL